MLLELMFERLPFVAGSGPLGACAGLSSLGRAHYCSMITRNGVRATNLSLSSERQICRFHTNSGDHVLI
jgi:hypothetical protein